MMSSNNRMNGGDSQSWMNQVTNGYPHQAESATNNFIKLTNPAINQSGGKSSKSGKYLNKSKKGGYGFSELAIPAILVIANQRIGKKTGKKYRNKKRRFSQRRR
jgi:hypothetical protein